MMHTKGSYCVVDDCKEETVHISGYCLKHRTFKCPKCGKTHTIMKAPRRKKDRLCAHCRRYKGNVNRYLDGEYDE